MDAPSRYPLAWPAHRPRTKVRKNGPFREDAETRFNAKQPIGMPRAIDRLEAELDRLGATLPLISSNIEPRLDGRPRAGARTPDDPGVALYFQLKGKPHTMACDTYTQVEQNIAALAAHIEATRKIERLGVATASEVLQAFAALPPPPAGPITRPWREVFGFPSDFATAAYGLDPSESKVMLDTRFRKLAAAAHPDKHGGNTEAMAELTRARADGVKEIGGAK